MMRWHILCFRVMFRKWFGSRKESCSACFSLQKVEPSGVEGGDIFLRAAEYMWGKSLLSYRMKQMERVRRDSETAAGCNG